MSQAPRITFDHIEKRIIIDHAPVPGPLYWAWRCTVCSEPVSNHAGFFRRWWYRRKVGGGLMAKTPNPMPVHVAQKHEPCALCGKVVSALDLVPVGPQTWWCESCASVNIWPSTGRVRG